ncbi:MAG: ketopantoate reductase family protein [Dehalococcoidia bacterium]|nr:ketopantoate reductase family protein [Dehalococcoidia bacterium]
MKVIVLGAGGLGSIIAGHLSQAGEDVTLVARGDRAKFLVKNGITITGVADFNTPCTISTEPKEITHADVLMVAVKTYHLEEALASVAHIKFSSVLSVQNGVQSDESLASVFGQSNTVGSSPAFSGEVQANGDVQFTVNGGFAIGELPTGVSDRVQALVSMLQGSGINSEAAPNIRSLQWSKFAAWAAGMPLAVTMRLESHKFFSDPDCALIFARILREVGNIAAEKSIPLVDRGPFLVEAILSGPEEEAVSVLREMGIQFAKNAPNHRWSSLLDLERGRKLEIDETLGYAVAEAKKLGVPVPTLEVCYSIVSGINRNI